MPLWLCTLQRLFFQLRILENHLIISTPCFPRRNFRYVDISRAYKGKKFSVYTPDETANLLSISCTRIGVPSTRMQASNGHPSTPSGITTHDKGCHFSREHSSESFLLSESHVSISRAIPRGMISRAKNALEDSHLLIVHVLFTTMMV